MVDFTQPHDPAYLKGRVEQTERRYRLGIARLKKAVAAGVPFLTGTDSRVTSKANSFTLPRRLPANWKCFPCNAVSR